MKILSSAWNLFMDALSRLILNVIAGLLALFTISLFLQVLTRFVIKMPLAWTEEVARFFFVWMVFLGSAYGVRKIMHYRIELLIQIFPQKARAITDLLVNLFVLGFFVLVVINAADFYHTIKMQNSPVLQISMGIPYSAVIAFGAAGLLFSLEAVFGALRALKRACGPQSA